jgi:hypothetical protein
VVSVAVSVVSVAVLLVAVVLVVDGKDVLTFKKHEQT